MSVNKRKPRTLRIVVAGLVMYHGPYLRLRDRMTIDALKKMWPHRSDELARLDDGSGRSVADILALLVPEWSDESGSQSKGLRRDLETAIDPDERATSLHRYELWVEDVESEPDPDVALEKARLMLGYIHEEWESFNALFERVTRRLEDLIKQAEADVEADEVG